MQRTRGNKTANGMPTRSMIINKTDIGRKRPRDTNVNVVDQAKKPKLDQPDNLLTNKHEEKAAHSFKLFLEDDEKGKELPLTPSNEVNQFDTNQQKIAMLEIKEQELLEQQCGLNAEKMESQRLFQHLKLIDEQLQTNQSITHRTAAEQADLTDKLLNLERQLNLDRTRLYAQARQLQQAITERVQEEYLKLEESKQRLLQLQAELDEKSQSLKLKEENIHIVEQQTEKKLAEKALKQLQEKEELEKEAAEYRKIAEQQQQTTLEQEKLLAQLTKQSKEQDKLAEKQSKKKDNLKKIAAKYEKIDRQQKQTTLEQAKLLEELTKRSNEYNKRELEQDKREAALLQERENISNFQEIAEIKKQLDIYKRKKLTNQETTRTTIQFFQPATTRDLTVSGPREQISRPKTVLTQTATTTSTPQLDQEITSNFEENYYPRSNPHFLWQGLDHSSDEIYHSNNLWTSSEKTDANDNFDAINNDDLFSHKFKS